jgi:CRP-like cAMP-binding protein
MLEKIKKNIQTLVAFSELDLMHFLSLFTDRKLKKNEFFLREGEVCNEVAFVNSGLLRLYFLADGREHVDGFSLPGEWLTDYASFLTRQKSTLYIEALADCELLVLSYDNIRKMYDRGKDFERFGRIMAEHLFVESFARGRTLALETPETRYQKLLKEQPHWFNLVPLKQIASYLGIEPESLSRIRKRMIGKTPER